MTDKPTTRAEAKVRATTTPNRFIPSPAARLWLYGILLAGVALAIGYGILTIDQGGLWLALGAAILGVGPAVAAANVPKH